MTSRRVGRQVVSMSDLSVERSIMQALADNPRVHPDEIVVQVHDGAVVLRGSVGSPVQRVEAARTARAVPGVDALDDQLRVRLMGVDGRADADTEAAVLDALVADPEVPANDIGVEVRDGNVTLRGMVALYAQRDRAERIAMAVPGVAAVDNHVRVWLTVSADDVAEHVTNALGVDAIVGADQITVTVVDNDVTLAGIVTSPEHRTTALAAAARAPGVEHVNDALTVRSHPS
jgi:osmotically-inducible protein OsmY